MKLSSKPLTIAVVAGILSIAASQTFGQKPKLPKEDAPRPGNRTEIRPRAEVDSRTESTIFRSSLVIGSTVSLQGDAEFGTVEEFIVNPGGCIDFIVVTYEDQYYPIPWTMASFDFQERVVFLDVDLRFIQSAPAFTQITELSNTQFVQKVNSYYKVDARRDGSRSGGTSREGANPRTGQRDRPGDKSRNSDKDAPGTRDERKPGDKASDGDKNPPGGTKSGGAKKPDVDKKPTPEKKPGEAKPLPPDPKEKPTSDKPTEDDKKSKDDEKRDEK